MSELVLPAWLCLLMDWILFKEPGTATFSTAAATERTASSVDLPEGKFNSLCCSKIDLHLLVFRHQTALQFLRVSKLLQQVQGQFLVQALLGQEHVLQRGPMEYRLFVS